MAIFPSTSIPSAASEFDIPNSLRFTDESIAHLRRVPSSNGSNQKYTFSFWFKIGKLARDSQNYLIGSYYTSANSGSRYFLIGIRPVAYGGPGDQLFVFSGNYGTLTDPSPYSVRMCTTRRFRDPAAWYHMVIAIDTTQATDTNRLKGYINGELIDPVTGWNGHDNTGTTPLWPVQNSGQFVNKTDTTMEIGGISPWAGAAYQLDGYMAEFHFIDGTQYAPSDFGETDSNYGHWKPKEVTGLTYGTNGFYLNFQNASSLGNDESGNNNDLTKYNLSPHDQMLDSPTNNFCVHASNMKHATTALYTTEGNLRNIVNIHTTSNATIKVGAGKWYWEWFINTGNGANKLGIASDGQTDAHSSWAVENRVIKSADGYKYTGTAAAGGAWSAYGVSYTTGDKMACALDMDNKCWYFAKNNVWMNSGDPTSGATQTGAITLLPQEDYMHWGPMTYTSGGGGVITLNCGQDGSFIGIVNPQGNTDGNGIGNFYYTPPTGFLALCTKNLPTPSIKPKEHYNTILWAGNSTARTISGVGFQPDLVWLKSRVGTTDPPVYDSVRGATKLLYSSNTSIQGTVADGFTGFVSDGFTLGADNATWDHNYTGRNYVGWNWKAGGAGSSNTNGSINTITTSANPAAGFSISTYTGTGSNATVGHGLSEPPNLVIIKNITTAGNSWVVGAGIGTYGFDGYNFDHQYLTLDTTANWANPTSTLFQGTGGNNGPWPTNQFVRIGTNDKVNKSGDTFVMYCWHSVLGYSMIGSYNGDATDDGPLVHCGFKPAWILIKNEGSGKNWWCFDAVRTGAVGLRVDANNAEESGIATNGKKILDIYSNGFKPRNSSYDVNTGSGGTHLYMAFADTPFKYANAN